MLHIKRLKEKKDKIYIEREIPYIDTYFCVLKKIVRYRLVDRYMC